VDEFKAAIGEKQKQVEEISKRINLGLEQDIECDVLLNTPEKGRKSFVAVATGQIVKVEDMTSADYQSRLFDPTSVPIVPIRDRDPVYRNRCTSGTGDNRVAGKIRCRTTMSS
jgi:hypothetical protein